MGTEVLGRVHFGRTAIYLNTNRRQDLFSRMPPDIAYVLAHNYQHVLDFRVWTLRRPWNYVRALGENVFKSHDNRFFERNAIQSGCVRSSGKAPQRDARCGAP